MVLAAAVVTSNSALVKVGTNQLSLSALDIVFWRSFVTVPLAYLMTGGDLRIRAWRWMVMRAGFGFTAMWGSFTATKGLGVGELSVLSRLHPIFVGLIAPLLLGVTERPGARVWLAMAVGLVGTSLMVSADLTSLDWSRLSYALLAVAAAAASATAHTALRALGATERSRTVVFWFQAAVGVFAGVLLLVTTGTLQVPTWPEAQVIGGVGAMSLLGQQLMTRAYQLDGASRVATAAYSGPVFGFLLDLAVFALVPSWTDAVGAVVVVGAGALLASSSRPSEDREAHRKAQ